MLKVIGHMYTDTNSKENFSRLVKAITDAGFTVAYNSSLNVTIIEEVPEQVIEDE